MVRAMVRTGLGAWAMLVVISMLLWALVGLVAPSFAGAKTVINVVGHWSGWQLTKFQENAAKYMELNPDVQIEFIHVPTDKAEGVSKILLLLGSEETRPDIVHAYTAVTPELLAGGVLAPMPQEIVSKVEGFFIPQLLPGLTYQGRLYGIPTENQNYVLGYNDRLFVESGIGEPPRTWSDLREYARKLVVVEPDGRVQRYGFALGNNFILISHGLFTLIWSNGGEYVDPEGGVHLNSEPVVETVEFITDMIQANIATLGIPDGRHPLVGAAMASSPTWWRQGLMASADADFESLRTAVMPVNQGAPAAYQYGWGLFVTEASPHPDEAWKFLQWLTMETDETGQTRMGNHMAQLGSLPTNMSDLYAHADFLADAFYAGFIDGLDVGRGEPMLPQISRRQETVANILTPVFEGREPAKAALEELQRQIEMILAESM